MKDLQHSQDSKVQAALKEAREKGTLQWVKPLLKAFQGRREDGLKEEMRDMLGSLKLSGAEALFLGSLEDPHFEDIRADLLGFLWSCGFECTGNLSVVAKHACVGDFRAAMEGSTLIEQIESVGDEQDLMDAMVVIREAANNPELEAIRPFIQAMHSHLTGLEERMI